ncbi:MAG TPA: hypothetical protein VFL88_06690 [Gemmatimonadales bacterium]|jgi:hypothetical protein|nr:hypothetical protein [Gemmatimonadales bacterium]
MAARQRRDIEALIQQQDTRLRSDFDDRDLGIYVRTLIIATGGERQFSAITPDIHLYRDLRWSIESADRFRTTLETVFRVELPEWKFLCARTVSDVISLLGLALSREGRRLGGSSPAA